MPEITGVPVTAVATTLDLEVEAARLRAEEKELDERYEQQKLGNQKFSAFLGAMKSYGLSSMDVDNIDVFLKNCEKAADYAIAYAFGRKDAK